MRFADPTNFLLLLLVLALAGFVVLALRRKKRLIERFGDLPLIMRNAPYISFARQGSKAALVILALALVVVALARLQFGTHLELLKREARTAA